MTSDDGDACENDISTGFGALVFHGGVNRRYQQDSRCIYWHSHAVEAPNLLSSPLGGSSRGQEHQRRNIRFFNHLHAASCRRYAVVGKSLAPVARGAETAAIASVKPAWQVTRQRPGGVR